MITLLKQQKQEYGLAGCAALSILLNCSLCLQHFCRKNISIEESIQARRIRTTLAIVTLSQMAQAFILTFYSEDIITTDDDGEATIGGLTNLTQMTGLAVTLWLLCSLTLSKNINEANLSRLCWHMHGMASTERLIVCFFILGDMMGGFTRTKGSPVHQLTIHGMNWLALEFGLCRLHQINTQRNNINNYVSSYLERLKLIGPQTKLMVLQTTVGTLYTLGVQIGLYFYLEKNNSLCQLKCHGQYQPFIDYLNNPIESALNTVALLFIGIPLVNKLFEVLTPIIIYNMIDQITKINNPKNTLITDDIKLVDDKHQYSNGFLSKIKHSNNIHGNTPLTVAYEFFRKKICGRCHFINSESLLQYQNGQKT